MVTKVLPAFVLAAGIASVASGAVSLTGSSYTQNFDGIGPATTAAFSSTAGTQALIPGNSNWDGVKVSGTGTSGMNFVVDTGTGNSGALYSYGAASATDRALGSLASGSNVPAFGVAITNNTGAFISNPTLSFSREVWRSSNTAVNTLAFAYGLSGSTATASNYLTDASLSAASAFDLVGEAVVTTNGAEDGNADAVTVSGVLNATIPAGSTLFLRWTDTNDTGNDAGIAIDNFSLSTTAVPEPTTIGLLSLAGLAALRRRRA